MSIITTINTIITVASLSWATVIIYHAVKFWPASKLVLPILFLQWLIPTLVFCAIGFIVYYINSRRHS